MSERTNCDHPTPWEAVDIDGSVECLGCTVERLYSENKSLIISSTEAHAALAAERTAHAELIADVDSALENGINEHLWPPGKTRGEAIKALRDFYEATIEDCDDPVERIPEIQVPDDPDMYCEAGGVFGVGDSDE